MKNVDNRNPKNNLITRVQPKNIAVANPNPHNNLLNNQTFTYLETRTILKGQPIPWGLNWLITYPVTLVFQGVRL